MDKERKQEILDYYSMVARDDEWTTFHIKKMLKPIAELLIEIIELLEKERK